MGIVLQVTVSSVRSIVLLTCRLSDSAFFLVDECVDGVVLFLAVLLLADRADFAERFVFCLFLLRWLAIALVMPMDSDTCFGLVEFGVLVLGNLGVLLFHGGRRRNRPLCKGRPILEHISRWNSL